MSVQLIVYPQSYDGSYNAISSSPSEALVNGISFTNLDSSTSYDSPHLSNILVDVLTNAPPIIVNTWYRYRSITFGTPNLPDVVTGDLVLYSTTSQTISGIYQKLSNLTVGVQYTITINFSAASSGFIITKYANGNTIYDSGQAMSSTYTVNLNCPTLKGYEPIRLTWLNQWGTWDYYTFKMKSSKMLSTKGSTYQQLEGSWNESAYRIDSFKGVKKAFRVNATEKISMNTDFVSESESVWFEELINSPEVYILEGFKTDTTNSALNKYVTPVRLTTSNYTKKTVANDRLMQYTFEVEKSKTLRTQAV